MNVVFAAIKNLKVHICKNRFIYIDMRVLCVFIYIDMRVLYVFIYLDMKIPVLS